MDAFTVAPFAGAWIEIDSIGICFEGAFVAPFAGAWIEINWTGTGTGDAPSRSLRGSVD